MAFLDGRDHGLRSWIRRVDRQHGFPCTGEARQTLVGIDDDELELAADRVSLGPNILRTETAVVATSALCVTFER